MFLLCTFLGFAISKLKQDMEAIMSKKVDTIAAKYDEILETKSKLLHAEVEQKTDQEEMIEYFESEYDTCLQSAQWDFVKHADYVDDSFPIHYRLVKQQFQNYSYDAMCKISDNLLMEKKDFNVHEYKELMNEFTCDLQYEMYTLRSSEQLEVMRSAVQNSVAKKRILNKYVQGHPDFEFKNFMDYVRDYIYYNDSTIYIYSSNDEPAMLNTPNQIVFVKDTGIVEGYKIRFKDRLHDCSL